MRILVTDDVNMMSVTLLQSRIQDTNMTITILGAKRAQFHFGSKSELSILFPYKFLE